MSTSYAWIYRLSAYGQRVDLYISKLSVAVGEIMDDPALLDDLEEEMVQNNISIDMFEQSMIFI